MGGGLTSRTSPTPRRACEQRRIGEVPARRVFENFHRPLLFTWDLWPTWRTGNRYHRLSLSRYVYRTWLIFFGQTSQPPAQILGGPPSLTRQLAGSIRACVRSAFRPTCDGRVVLLLISFCILGAKRVEISRRRSDGFQQNPDHARGPQISTGSFVDQKSIPLHFPTACYVRTCYILFSNELFFVRGACLTDVRLFSPRITRKFGNVSSRVIFKHR